MANHWNPYEDSNDWYDQQNQLNALKEEAYRREMEFRERGMMQQYSQRAMSNASPLASARPESPNKLLLLL